MPRVEGDTYFNNFVQNGYEELKGWTPRYYQGIKEADANLQFAGKTIDIMALALEDWCLNMFIDTMNESTLSRWEAFYYLDNSSRTLEERRRLLKAAQLGSGKMSVDRIKRIIMVYAGVDCTVDFVHELVITLDAGDVLVNFTDFTSILGRQLPAHLAWHVHQEMEQRNTIYHGAAIAQTYIAAPIKENAGDRVRDISSISSSFGTALASVSNNEVVSDGGTRERLVNGKNVNSGTATVSVKLGAMVSEWSERTGEIAGADLSGVNVYTMVSQTIR